MTPQEGSGWQPIETAPTDGTDVLVFQPETSEQFVAYWHSGSDWQYAYFAPQKVCIACKPTHWRPLPEPPKISA